MDAVQAANSGHPGTPMALAPLVYTLWNRVMRFDPQDPIWPGRDRFVLSNGHASMLLWSMLHLTGTRAVNADYERLGEPSVTLDDIRRFRQLGSKAPGHPEYRLVSGVETTTGPLGQGIATSVGMAIGERWLADRYNQPGFEVFDYNIYAICGDGCLMEGVSAEAASLAGHLGLDHLCWIFDNNHITIEGSTDLAFTEDVAARFLAYGWNVLRVGDANDIDRIEHALGSFGRPRAGRRFIILDSSIGYGSPNRQGTAAAHGEPLGDEEIRLTKRVYGWPEDATFLVPDGVREHFDAGVGKRGADARRAWTELFAAYRSKYPGSGDGDRSDAAAQAAGRLGSEPPGVPGRSEGHGGTGGLGQGAERPRAERPVVPGWLGGPRSLEQDHADVRRRRRSPGRQPRRQESALRRARARDGLDHERAVADEAAAVRRDLLHLQRLRAARDPALRPDGAADDLRLHARRDERRRGRPDPSAGRAPGVAPRDSRSRLCCGPATPTKWWRPTATSCRCATSLRCSCCRGSRCRRSIGASTPRPPASPAAPTSWPTRRTASPM